MQHIETIIVGAGPAGSTCAWQLNRQGREVLMLDKAEFPRTKLCAGWITPKVMNDLEFTMDDYPYAILNIKIHSHIKGLPFACHGSPIPGETFSIRRIEFDDWLRQRSGVETVRHTVKAIRRDGGRFVVDETYSCDNLIGAGGTACPVRRIMFPENRRKFRQVVTLEREFEYPARADICHLYFLHYGAKAYAWYFPKGDGFVNIGLGGKANFFRKADGNIHTHFKRFLSDLVEQGLLDPAAIENFGEAGHPYYLNSEHGEIKQDRCYLIGDAAGLATVDLGEGIGPAIESALMAAGEITGTASYSKTAVTQFSSGGVLRKLAERFVAPKPASAVR